MFVVVIQEIVAASKQGKENLGGQVRCMQEMTGRKGNDRYMIIF